MLSISLENWRHTFSFIKCYQASASKQWISVGIFKLASEMSFAILESKAVELVIVHMSGLLKTAVIYGNLTTIMKQFDGVAQMERRIKDRTIPLSQSSQPSSESPSSSQARKMTTKVVATPSTNCWLRISALNFF